MESPLSWSRCLWCHSGANAWSLSGAGVGVWSLSGAGVCVWGHSGAGAMESLLEQIVWSHSGAGVDVRNH